MSAAIEALAAYFSGPCVALHSVGLGLSGPPHLAANKFFDTRRAVGVQGYVTLDEARAAIIESLADIGKKV